jgi:2-oxoglutarate ferredoxin oxidoreductase subunit beta
MESKKSRGLAGADDSPLNPVMIVLSAGCGFVARTHAGNMPHMRAMFREAIEYPGFAFVHAMAGCVTYQPRGYADQLLERSYELPASHDPTSLDAAYAVARDERFGLGVLYRRPVAAQPVASVPRADHAWNPAGDTSRGDLAAE